MDISEGFVVTLVHFYCGLRQVILGVGSGCCGGSNPCPFLLWIATDLPAQGTPFVSLSSNPCPFLLWIATVWCQQAPITPVQGSNPCPFLLWIATTLVAA